MLKHLQTLQQPHGTLLSKDGINTVEAIGYDEGSADLVLAGNRFENPYFGGANYATMATASRYSVGGVYLKPSAFGAVIEDLEPYIGTFFDAVNYKGAFDPASTAWTAVWTVPAQLGYFAD